MNKTKFHLAIPVHNIKEAKYFYGTLLNCSQGRSSDTWVDYNFYGHQLVIHLDTNIKSKSYNSVDGESVPIPHFGLVLKWEDWELMREKLEKENIEFIINPYIRFEGEVGEQATMFIKDPSNNFIEFKSFKNDQYIFASD